MSNDLEIIEGLEGEIGIKLKQLEKIDFRKPINGYVIDKNKNIIGLCLCITQISDVSPLGNLQKLNKLYLSLNKISDVSPLGNLQSLTHIDLSDNKISDVSPLGNLQKLTELYLSSNKISDVSPLGNLQKLTHIDLTSNKISDVSPLGNLQKLTHIDLRGTNISDVSPLRNLQSLTELDLISNKISDVSPLGNLQKLNKLYLSSNKISDVSPLGNLQSLTELDLRGNKISDVSPLGNLQSLTELYLSSNKISDVSPLGNLQKLNKLYLSLNKISDVSPLGSLQSLTELDLSDNQISDVSPLGSLHKLIRLDLKSNQISELPKEMLDLDMEIKWEDTFLFKDINLCNNPITSPPLEIVKKGRDAVREYLKSLEGEKQVLSEVKVLLVGDGGAGKTSLVRRLLWDKFDKNESQTPGININKWEIGDGENRIKVNIWDFGGQEIMHATHQFFLSKRSLYILVLDGRRDEKTEYWLKHIESFGGDSPILVVLNKMDEKPDFYVDSKSLQEKYRGIKGFYQVSCADGRGIKDFKENLSREMIKVELIKTTWATRWSNVKTQLENMTKDFITYDEYKEMCEKENITEKLEQDTLVDFLNDLGVILHFKDFKLKHTHILEPKWVTGAVYKIINSDILATCKGVLRLNCLDEILKKKKAGDYFYPYEKHHFIIDLMKKFELCYEIDEETVLIPDLLAVQEPEFYFDYATSLKFVIGYDFLPGSIIHRFIVKMHGDIKNNLRWRTGVVLEDKDFNSTAVIKSDNEAKKIYIYVNGEQKRDYFSVILFTFREINRIFEKLEFDERVCLPDNPKITVSYSHLIRLEKMRQENYIPEGAKKVYNVKDLLGTIYSEKKNEEEILRILRKLKSESDSEESLLEKVIIAQPTIMGFGIDLKKLMKLIKKVFGKK